MGGLLSYFRIMICSLEFIIDFCFCTEVSRIITFKVVKKKRIKQLSAFAYMKKIFLLFFFLSLIRKLLRKKGPRTT